MSENLGKPIALGRTAEIYAWQNQQVLKLFYDWFPQDAIEYEKRISQAVFSSGLPVPSVGEIIRDNDRVGLIYGQVKGISMDAMLQHRPWYMFRYARRMAELHAEMHNNAIQVDLPGQRDRIREKITQARVLSTEFRLKITAALEMMPDGDRICHGDFHPGNIMVTKQAEIIIDWIDATRGNPLADLARTSIIMLGVAESAGIQNAIIKLIVRFFQRVYLNRYFTLRPGGKNEYARWLPIVAAARLSENIKELEKWLIGQAKTI
jgi:uncharacterized protein (TIGR02172 family)